MPGFELFGAEERESVGHVLDSGVLMRYGFDGQRNGHWKVAELEQAGWSDPRLHKIGEIDPMLMSGKDAVIEGAYEAAVADGASMIIYREADDGYVGEG